MPGLRIRYMAEELMSFIKKNKYGMEIRRQQEKDELTQILHQQEKEEQEL